MLQEYGNEEWRKLKDKSNSHRLEKIPGSTPLENRILGKIEDGYVDINEREVKTKLIDAVVKATGIDRSSAAGRVRNYVRGEIDKSKLFRKKTCVLTPQENDTVVAIMSEIGCSRRTALERLRKYRVKLDCDSLWEPLNEKFRRKNVV